MARFILSKWHGLSSASRWLLSLTVATGVGIAVWATAQDAHKKGVEAAPLGRLFIDFGNPLFTQGDDYVLPCGVGGFVNSYRFDGQWRTNPPAWYVAASESNDVGSLSIELDRALLADDLIMELGLHDHADGASLFIDLRDADGVAVATNLFGNILTGTKADVELKLIIPLAANPEAAIIVVRRGAGEITVFDALLYTEYAPESDRKTPPNRSDSEDDRLPAPDNVAAAPSTLKTPQTRNEPLLLAYQPFDYATNTTLLDAGDHGNFGNAEGFTNDWIDVNDSWVASGGSLTYVDAAGNVLLTSGNHAAGKGDSGWDVAALELDLGRPGWAPYLDGDSVKQGGTLWISYLAKDSRFHNGSYFNLSPTSNPGDGGTQGRPGEGVLAFGEQYNNSNDFALWVDKARHKPDDNSAVNETQFVVIRLDLTDAPNADAAYAWLNPRLDSEPALSNAFRTVNTGGAPDRNLSLKFLSFRAGNPSAIDFDEVRIGTTYADVAPIAAVPRIAVTPAALDFGAIAGDSNATQSVTVTNFGDAVLNVAGFSFSGADTGLFAVVSAPPPWQVPVGASTNVTVTYAPAYRQGAHSATLTIESDAANAPATNVTLSGSATTIPMLLAYQPFDYPTTTTNISAGDDGNYGNAFGFANDWMNTGWLSVTGSLGCIDAGGNMLETSGNHAEGPGGKWSNGAVRLDLSSHLWTPYVTDGHVEKGGTLWMSFTVQDIKDSNAAYVGLTSSTNPVGSHPAAHDLAFGERYQNGETMLILDTKRAGTNTYFTGRHLVVIRLDLTDESGEDQATCWLDPALDVEPPEAEAAAQTPTGVTDLSVNHLYVRNGNPNVTDLDEMRIGTTWADVMPFTPPTDTDGDGLLDREEAVYGTSPTSVDSDGDGTADLVTVATLDGTNTSHRNGDWTENGTVLEAADDLTMRAEYAVKVPAADMYRLGLKLGNASGADRKQLAVQLSIDDVRMEWLYVNTAEGSNGWTFTSTPWLEDGEHTIRLSWLDNYDPDKRIAIEKLTIGRIDGPDANRNRRQDWVDDILALGLDSDGDGLTDLYEIEYGKPSPAVLTSISARKPTPLDPLCVDTDGDTLGDGEELNLFKTDPLRIHTDRDGVPDAALSLETPGADTVDREVGDITYGSVWFEEDDTLVSLGGEVFAWYDVEVTNTTSYRLGLQFLNYQADPLDDYEFEVEFTINGHELGEFSVFADVDLHGRGYVNVPQLGEGTHRIGIRWTNPDPVWWYPLQQQRRDSNIQVEKLLLYAVDGKDSNNDGIQDWVEDYLEDNPDQDTDGDGLTDFIEIFKYGTSVVLADTDGDNLDDGEEIALGTDPKSVDSDSDGIADGVEVNQAFTDPLRRDFDGTSVTLQTVNGRDATDTLGSWGISGNAIYAKARNGWVEYEINVPSNGTYGIEVEAAQHNPLSIEDRFDLVLSVDGTFSGRQWLAAPIGSSGTALFFTPHLSAGTHAVRIEWKNVEPNTFIEILAVRLKSFGGARWLSNRTGNMSALFAVPAASLISPVCIEGRTHQFDLLDVQASYAPEGQTQHVVTVRRGIENNWYANVLLSPTNATDLAVTNAAGSPGFSTNVTWETLNVLDTAWTNVYPAAGTSLTVRAADSLLLTAHPAGATNGTVTIEVLDGTNVVTNVVTTVDAPVQHLFETGGLFTVSGTYSNATLVTNATLAVEVADYSFSGNPACMLDSEREWECPNVPTNAVVEYDSRMTVEPAPLAGGGTELTLHSTTIEPLYMIARLGEAGPIADNARVDTIDSSLSEYVQTVTTFPDGSRLVRFVITLSTVPSDLTIDLHAAAGGVIFDDGTLNRTVTAADFNEHGQYEYFMVLDAGVDTSSCHTVRVYQGGVQID